MTSGGSIERHHIVTGNSEQIHNPHHMMTEPSNEAHYMVTGVKGHIHNHHDMVARGSEEFRNGHHMVTGQTAQTNQFPEFLTGRIQTPRNPSSHQYQNLSTQVSQDNNLPHKTTIYQWFNKHQQIKT